MNHSLVTLNNRIYVYGGKNSLGLVHSVEKYNPELNMWLVIKTNFETSLGMVICLRGDHSQEDIVVLGGRNCDGDEKSSASLANVKAPEVSHGRFSCMLEKRAFPAVAIL